MKTVDQTSGPLPSDDPARLSTRADAEGARHIGVVGDTYSILLDGGQTDGHTCLIDMHVPKGGGPAPHRHDFEETFTVLEGEIEATFRGEKTIVKAGGTLHVPANAPHSFTNAAEAPARLLCTCSPAGQEQFFLKIGVPVDGRTTPPPKLTDEEQKAFMEKSKALAPKYRTELLGP